MIVFSDLDGTLLGHDDYRFDNARPALAALRAQRIPLIVATSKTLAEVIDINHALDNRQPAIVENGGAICFPLDREYPFALQADETLHGHAIIRYAPGYARIRRFIQRQREHRRVRLQGFGDMTVDQVARLTGLDRETATLARQRLCSEPFIWLDDADRLQAFEAAAAMEGLRVTRGGRFWHLMGDTGKAHAMLALHEMYTEGTGHASTLVALGDSENDCGMLQAADIAVVVKRHDGHHIDCRGIRRTLFTEHQGPAGWNEAVLQIVSRQGSAIDRRSEGG